MWKLQEKALSFEENSQNSPRNYCFFDTFLMLLKLRKMGRKPKQSPEVPILTRELCFYKQRSVFWYVSASPLHNVYLAFLWKIDPSRKNDISGYIWHRSFIQTAKCSLLDEKIVYQSFYGAPLTLIYFFTSRKSSVFDTCWQDLFVRYLTQIVHSNGKMLFL